MAFKTYCWSVGTTSFRVKQLNYKIEKQLQMLNRLYSDPMSKEELNDIEGKIKVEFEEYTDVILKYDEEKINKISDELLNLVNDRNRKCKLLK